MDKISLDLEHFYKGCCVPVADKMRETRVCIRIILFLIFHSGLRTSLVSRHDLVTEFSNLKYYYPNEI